MNLADYNPSIASENNRLIFDRFSRHEIDLKPCRLCAHKLSDFYVDYSTFFSLGNLVYTRSPKSWAPPDILKVNIF